MPALPFAALFGMLGGVDFIWWALPASDVLGLVAAVVLMRKMHKRVISKMPDSESSAETKSV